MASSYRLGRTLTAGYRGALDYITYLQTLPKAPVMPSAYQGTVEAGLTVITLEFNTPLDEAVLPPTSAFVVNLDGVATGTIAGLQVVLSSVELTMTDPLAGTGVITVDYTPGSPALISQKGVAVAAFSVEIIRL